MLKTKERLANELTVEKIDKYYLNDTGEMILIALIYIMISVCSLWLTAACWLS